MQGIDSILPVDVYVPGCPPRPDAMIDAILKLQKKIERENPLRRLLAGPRVVDERGHGLLLRQPNAALPRSTLDLHPHDPRAKEAEAPR